MRRPRRDDGKVTELTEMLDSYDVGSFDGKYLHVNFLMVYI